MQTKLNLISSMAKKDKKCRFNNLIHLLNEENLTECFYYLKRNKAPGIDGVSFDDYEENLEENIQELVRRMKQMSYRPQPVKRIYIPKENGKQRPLGLPAIEDKIVQQGISLILQTIYEVDFLDFSYGFRPNKGCHDALNHLDKMIMCNPVNYVIDADIKGFFDNVDHEWMMKFLGERIADQKFLRYIIRFLRAGIIDDGIKKLSEKGTPQGGVISPILSNIYLHYVLDLWMEKHIKRNYQGYIGIVRYADDFIICVQHKEESEKLLKELEYRLDKFGLSLSQEKTRLIEFGKNARPDKEKKGNNSRSFNFLGFTHYCARTRKGSFKVGRTTDRKKFSSKLKEMNLWLKRIRNQDKPNEWWRKLCSKLRGHFQYYGVSDNYNGIKRFYYETVKLLYKWLNRRSQKKSFNWEIFKEYLKRHPIPKPKIYHNFYTTYGF